MPSASQAKTESDLETVRIAKDLFLSEWYRTWSHRLLDDDGRELLDRVREETQEERENLLDIVREWAAREEPEAKPDVNRVLYFSRKEFLRELILAKDAAGEGIEKIALLAPPDLRERLLKVAAVDFRHALALRQELARTVDEATK